METEKKGGSLGLFLLLAFALSWTGVVIDALSIAGILPFQLPIPIFSILSQFMPTIVAIFMIRREFGGDGLRAFFRRFSWRDGRRWILPLIVALPAIVLPAILVYLMMGGVQPNFPRFPVYTLPLLYPVLIVLGFIFGGISEEFGWRGYALPLLQRRSNALVASVFMAIIWTVWHLHPTTLAVAFTDGVGPFVRQFATESGQSFAQILPQTILVTWIFNKTRGNLFLSILAHGVGNGLASTALVSWEPLPQTLNYLYAAVLAVLAIIVLVRDGAEHLNKDGRRFTDLLWE